MMKTKLKHWCISIAALLTGFVTILFMTASIWYRPLEKVKVSVCNDVNAQAAYDYTKYIAENYQYRTFGSQAVMELGNYIGNFFCDYGMEVTKQEFTSWRPNADKFYLKFDLADNDVNLFSDSYESLIEHVKGINIIGISKGESDEVILIGAHRDMAYGIEGAEDNASGTGLMMELSKELTSKEHYYTYMFVSFDGEEAQEKGSDYFIKNYEGVDKIKLAVILDQVGYRAADSLMTYGRYGSFEQLSLGTQSLLNSCLNVTGSANISYDSRYTADKGFEALLTHIKGKGFAAANTDCNPFFEKQIPAFGIKAINAEKMEEAAVHCLDDNMDNISAETIRMSGNFVKTMLQTIELDPSILEGLADQSDYVLSGASYLPSENLMAARILLGAMLGGLFLYAICYLVRHASKKEWLLCLEALGFSILWTCILCFGIRYGIATVLKKIPVMALFLLWILTLIAGIVWIKNKIYKEQVNRYILLMFQQLINGITCIVIAWQVSLEYAVVIGIIAILVSIGMQQVGEGQKKIRAVVLTSWVILHFAAMAAAFNVFLRGVDINRFVLLQLMSLLVFITMNVNVFNRNRQH